MIKVLKITGYYANKDKFGNDQWQVDGVSYDKFSQEYKGFPTKRIWIKRNVIGLTDADLGKTLYAEYNEKGNIVQCEVK